MRLRTVQVFSVLLLLVNCGRDSLRTSSHSDGSIAVPTDATIDAAGSGQGGIGGSSGSGGIAGSGGVSTTGSGGSAGSTGSGGSAGSAGSGGTQIVSAHPIAKDGQLDPGAVLNLVVAQDERHVAFMRDYLPVPPCGKTGEELIARSQQVGTLLVATVSEDGTVAVRTVGQSVKFFSVGFSADSTSMAYVDGYDPCSQGGVLKTAASDGTNPRTVAPVPINFEERIAGNTLLFVQPPAGLFLGQVYAAALPNGAPTPIPVAKDTFSGVWMSPDGSRAGYFDDAGTANVLDVATGKSQLVAIVVGVPGPGPFLWSPDGRSFAVEYPLDITQRYDLAVAGPDHLQATYMVRNGPLPNPAFSPDGSQLAYVALTDSDTPELVIHPLAGGGDVRIQGLPHPNANFDYLSFSPDGGVVLVMARDNTSSAISLYAASVLGSNSLRLITANVGGSIPSNSPGDANRPPAVPPGDGDVAVALNSGGTQVFSLSGGATSTLLPGNAPAYEPGSAQPRLLLGPLPQASASYPVLAFVLTATDGSGVQSAYLPTTALPWGPNPQWIGHTVVYGFSPALTGDFPAIYATSSVGASPTLLAANPSSYAFAPIPAPTRLFYGRAAASTAGPAGLWMTTIP